MKADIVTIFPDFFRGPLEYGITRRAQEMGLAEIQVYDLREFTRRSPPHGGRPAVRRRRRHGVEAGTAV